MIILIIIPLNELLEVFKVKRFLSSVLLIVILASLFILSSCVEDKQDNCDDFDYTTDYQYYYNNINMGSLPITKSDTGYYFFLANRFLHYMDKESLETTPVCNKANCLHNNRDECDAYFNTYKVPTTVAGSNVVQYYDNNLYVVLRNDDEYGEFVGTSLYKVSLDGTSREKLISFDFGIPAWLIHRGDFYYAKEKYNDNVNAAINIDSFSINKISLDNLKEEPIKIFDTNEYFDCIQGVYQFSAYDNYIITSVVPLSEKAIEELTTEGERELLIEKYYYSICTDSLEVNRISNEEGKVSLSSFYNDKLLYIVEGEESNTNRYFTCELDGSNPSLLTEMKYGDSLFYDGNHMFLQNFIEDFKESSEGNGGNKISLLDSSFKPISTFRIGFDYSGGIPQDPECFLCINNVSNTDTEVYYIDKSELNKLNGEEVEYKTVYSSEGESIVTKNSVSEIDTSLIMDTNDTELRGMFDNTKQKLYKVSLTYDNSLDKNISGGFSVNMHWNGDGGSYTGNFQILKFGSENEVSNFVKKNPFSLVNGKYIAFVSIDSVPIEIKEMLDSIISNEPITPIEIHDFSGEMYSFK